MEQTPLDTLSSAPTDLPVALICRSREPLWRRANHGHVSARPVPDQEGRLADRHQRWVQDAMDAEASLDERRLRPAKPFGEDGRSADGEAVWF